LSLTCIEEEETEKGDPARVTDRGRPEPVVEFSHVACGWLSGLFHFHGINNPRLSFPHQQLWREADVDNLVTSLVPGSELFKMSPYVELEVEVCKQAVTGIMIRAKRK
jgi:hypothetical protein